MRFANLEWLLAQRRIARYQLASLLRTSEGSISRKLSGRSEFLPHERTRVSEFLGYQQSWLFQETVPPDNARLERLKSAVANVGG